MKCPHCQYEHGYSDDAEKNINGKEGEFWRHPVMIERARPYDDPGRANVFACPKCGILFIVP